MHGVQHHAIQQYLSMQLASKLQILCKSLQVLWCAGKAMGKAASGTMPCLHSQCPCLPASGSPQRQAFYCSSTPRLPHVHADVANTNMNLAKVSCLQGCLASTFYLKNAITCIPSPCGHGRNSCSDGSMNIQACVPGATGHIAECTGVVVHSCLPD